MSNYRKTMTEALREMYPLDESVIDKVKEIASKKQAMKIDGVMVDSFTASAISQIYDKVNDANKKKMEKLPITKLANLAFKMMQKNEFVPEEVDLDEVDRSTYSDRMKKYTAMLKDAEKEKPLDKEWIKLLKRRIKSESDDERKKLGMSEDVDLDEALKVGQKVKVKDKGKVVSGVITNVGKGQTLGVADVKLPDGRINVYGTDEINEEVDLEEGKLGDQWQKGAKSVKSGSFELVRGKSGVHDIMKSGKKIGTFSYDDEGDNFVANMKGERGQLVGNDIDTLISNFKEEVDLDEGKMSQLHQYIKDKKSAEEIAKLMKVDVKTIKTLMSSNNPEDVEESAASDARRAMSKDKDFSRKDSADDDTDASADDVKGASKNIMMQMRKAQSLNGRFAVEFGDGKKVKIPAKMAIAVQQKYNAQKRPAEKEKFQAKIGKSYKDMLSALKEELQPKKESILERMNRKIKENKDG